jgi:hypothetical protein
LFAVTRDQHSERIARDDVTKFGPGPSNVFARVASPGRGRSARLLRCVQHRRFRRFAAEQAVVVLSVRTNAYKLTDIAMNWREYDPTIGFFKDAPAGAFAAARHYGYWGVESSSPMEKAQYLVYKVKPGY